MNKLIFKGLLLGGVLFGAALYLQYLTTGTPPDVKGMTSGLLNQISRSASASISSVQDSFNRSVSSAAGNSKIYRWVDREGGVHYGDEHPEGAEQLEELTHVDPNTNMVQLPQPPMPQEAGQVSDAQSAGKAPANNHDSDTVKSVIEKAQEAKALMEQRNQQQQKLLDAL